MASKVKYGFKGTLNFNSGTYGTPVWNNVTQTRDMKIGADMAKQEASTRAGLGVKQYEPSMLDLMIDGKIRTDETDTTGFVALETAFLTRASIDMLMLDDGIAVSGSRGYRFDAKCFKLGEDQNLEGILFRDFEVAPCISANIAQKAVVTAGSPVFTPLG